VQSGVGVFCRYLLKTSFGLSFYQGGEARNFTKNIVKL
jgi:hypothetical protein